jgi:uncharacterized membrane protein
MTRYALLGVFIHKQTKITVVDDTTGKPVTDALVQYARADAKTDKNGVATINSMSVGDHPLKVEKKYYETIEASYTVPIFGEAKTKVRLKATGRVAVINVKNKISGNKFTKTEFRKLGLHSQNLSTVWKHQTLHRRTFYSI